MTKWADELNLILLNLLKTLQPLPRYIQKSGCYVSAAGSFSCSRQSDQAGLLPPSRRMNENIKDAVVTSSRTHRLTLAPRLLASVLTLTRLIDSLDRDGSREGSLRDSHVCFSAECAEWHPGHGSVNCVIFVPRLSFFVLGGFQRRGPE